MSSQIVRIVVGTDNCNVWCDLRVISDPDSTLTLDVAALHQPRASIDPGIDVLGIVYLTMWANRPVGLAVASKPKDFLQEPEFKRSPVLIVTRVSKES